MDRDACQQPTGRVPLYGTGQRRGLTPGVFATSVVLRVRPRDSEISYRRLTVVSDHRQ